MHRMNATDAMFMTIDDGRVHTGVSAVIITEGTAVDGTPMDLDRVRQVLEQRIDAVPTFRRRIKKVPLNLDYPVWVEDRGFDINEHLWELALPKPGTDKQLADIAARIHSRPLDMTRPLWELYFIHGLEGGRVAILIKMHHAAVDGMAMAKVLGTLMQPTPEGQEIELPRESTPEREPGDVELALRGIVALPRQAYRAARATPRVLRNMDQSPTMRTMSAGRSLSETANRLYDRLAKGQDGEILERYAGDAPKISMGGVVSAHRAWAFADLDLATFKAIRATTPGLTINDVMVALAAGAMRRRLKARGDLPTDPLVVMVPLFVGGGQSDTIANHVSMMFVPLPTNEPDILARLTKSHAVMERAKSVHHALPVAVTLDSFVSTPPALLAVAARAATATAAGNPPQQNVILSNLPGPQIPLYLAGAKVLGLYGINVIVDGQAASFTVFSYNGKMCLTLTTSKDHAPDVWELEQDVEDEFEAMVKATGVADQ